MVEQRRELVGFARASTVSVAELARRFGVSRQTVYKWLARFDAEGETGLADRSRRPVTSPARTVAEVEDLVCATRREFPGWGGRKIRGFLLRQGWDQVPAASTITAILRRNGLMVDKVPQRRQYQRFERACPNELWGMDFQGYFRLSDGTRCHPFGLIDDHSRYSLCLKACVNQKTATVKGHLEGTFQRYGLPQAMLMDNGSPWGNTFEEHWTPLTVWLCDLGIEVIHSRPFHPQTNGKKERLHATLDLEVIHATAQWDSIDQVQQAFDRWEPIYNYLRPHESLGETTVPADRYTPSPRSIPDLVTDPAYPANWYQQTVSPSSATLTFQGNKIKIGKPFRGKTVAVAPTPNPGIWHIYYRHHHIRTINTVNHVPEHP